MRNSRRPPARGPGAPQQGGQADGRDDDDDLQNAAHGYSM